MRGGKVLLSSILAEWTGSGAVEEHLHAILLNIPAVYLQFHANRADSLRLP